MTNLLSKNKKMTEKVKYVNTVKLPSNEIFLKSMTLIFENM